MELNYWGRSDLKSATGPLITERIPHRDRLQLELHVNEILTKFFLKLISILSLPDGQRNGVKKNGSIDPDAK